MKTPAHRCPHFLLAIFVGLLPAGTSAQVSPPVFRILAEPPAYKEAMERNRKRIAEAESLAETKMPACGTLVGSILPGSTAERLKIEPGMIVSMFDGVPSAWWIPWKDRTGMAEVVLSSADGTEIRHMIPPGMLGVYRKQHFRPELPLIRSHPGSTQENWWNHAILGALLAEEDPALSETAWAIALRQGYPEDLHSAYFAACFSRQRPGVFAAALDRFLEHAEAFGEIPLWTQETLISLLAAEGRVEDLSRLMRQGSSVPQWSNDEIGRLVELSSKLEPSTESTDPLQRVDSRPFRILNPQMRVIPRFDAGAMKNSGQLFIEPMRRISRPPGYYIRTGLEYEMATKTPHVRMNLANISVHGYHEKYNEMVELGLLSSRYNNGATGNKTVPTADQILASVKVSYSGYDPNGPKIPYFLLSSSRSSRHWTASTASYRKPTTLRNGDPSHEFENIIFDIFRLGDEVFIYINGTRFLRMPIDPEEDKLAVFFRIVGASVTFEEFTMREYRP